MQAFILSVLRNLVVAAALALLSRLIFRPDEADAPKAQANDFAPTSEEGTEIKHLFGTRPVPLLIVAVMERSVTPIRVG